jgi:hypothetical protein
MEVKLVSLLTSTLDGGEWLASCPDRFIAEENVLICIDTRLCGAPEPVCDVVAKKNILPCRESNPCDLVRSLVIILKATRARKSVHLSTENMYHYVKWNGKAERSHKGPMIIICIPALIITNSEFCSQSVFTVFVWLLE